MKEIKEIIKAFDKAQLEGKQTALATVVHVEGSSYRSPGARMLITEDGELTGAISGGCLEGDALKKARLVIFQQQSKLVTYNTTDDDDAKFGIGLGCNGIIHILIEPIVASRPDHPLVLLKSCVADRNKKVLVTLFDLKNKRLPQPGSLLLWNEGVEKGSLVEQDYLRPLIIKDIRKALEAGHSLINTYEGDRQFTAFVEVITPSVALVIVGAGNDAIHLMNLAYVLGWEITVVDGRTDYATKERFRAAQNIILSKADEVGQLLTLDKKTAVVLMTHNYHYDLAVLKQLLPLKAAYIGVLGPRKKTDKMILAIKKDRISIPEEGLNKLFGPVGLDIGADSPEGIALSIVAEIKTVFNRKTGFFLRDKPGPIHSGRKREPEILERKLS